MIRKKFRSLVVGMLLGTAKLTIHNTIRISSKDLEDLNYKKEVLQTNQIPPIILQDLGEFFRIETRQDPRYRIWGKLLYKNNVKIISRKVLDYLDEDGIRVWFKDSGALKKHELILKTNCSKEECETIVEYFLEKFDIKWRIYKFKDSFNLSMGNQEANKFLKLFQV